MSDRVNDWQSHITVASVIENNGLFLMVEEKIQGEIVINQPAGHVEANETLIAANIRETLEETGLHYQPTALIGVYVYKANQTTTYVRFCFTGKIREYKSTEPLDHDIIRAVWMSKEDLLQQKHKLRSPMVLECIEDYLALKRYPLEIIKDFGYGK